MSRAVELEGVTNVRDLGGVPAGEGRVVASGLIYRGGALNSATQHDCEVLFGQLGITRVIDVRCGWELDAKPDLSPASVENLHIPFFDLEKVGIEYTDYAEGTQPDGHDVACVPDHFYRSLANPLTVGQMREGLNVVFEHVANGGAVYVHCSGGKDRAGIMSLLVLHVLGASREAILEDYLATNIARDKDYDAMFERFLRLAQGNEELAHDLVISHRARPENLDAFYDAVGERYGSFETFMHERLGMDDNRIERIRKLCTIPVELS